MDKQILDLLTEISKDMQSIKSEMHDFRSEMHEFKSDMYEFKTEMHDFKSDMYEFKSEMHDFKSDMYEFKTEMYEFKSEMHDRFDSIEAKLVGVGGQFELTNESRIVDVDFIADKVNKLEKELYLLKTKTNN